MESIYSRSWEVNIQRDGKEKVLCNGYFLDNFVEKKVEIVARNNDFSILSAEIETLKGLSEDEHNTRQIFTGLSKVALNSGGVGKAVREAVSNDPGGYQTTILMEAIRGVVLSRSFFIKELGFADEQAYYDYTLKKLKNTCVFQSKQDIEKGRYRQLRKNQGFNQRTTTLFHRMQSLSIYRIDGDLQCHSSLVDSVHQMNLIIRLNNSLQVTGATGQIVRSPDVICCEATQTLSRLIGLSLNPQDAPSKPILRLVGGGDGCFHMGNMVLEIAASLELVSSQLGEI